MLKDRLVCGLSRAEYVERITWFHNYAAPGLLVGGFMVDAARRRLPEGTLFEAACETTSCLPDAVQLFTPCTVGNGWLRVLDLGRYALTLYDKYTGQGFRVHMDPALLGPYPEIAGWFLKRTPKAEQDTEALADEIFEAGESILTVRRVQVSAAYLGKNHKGSIAVCPACGEAYPAKHGGLCKGCLGGSPVLRAEAAPRPRAVPVAQAVGRRALHDMTEVQPGVSKEASFQRGQTITAGDLCRLQRMGRMEVFVEDEGGPEAGFVHEDDAATALAGALCQGGALEAAGPPREGKITLLAARDGLFTVDVERLQALNALTDVALSVRHHGSLVKAGEAVGGVRAIPLHLDRAVLDKALALCSGSLLLDVAPLRRLRAGALITGSEVFTGLIEDKFAPVLAAKLQALGSELAEVRFAPDDAEAIAAGARELLRSGCELILTTAGMSVDPGDVTRKGLQDAGVSGELFGMPVLPGNMLLLARAGTVPVIGVPACALFHQVTSLDILLPRVLAGQEITRADLAALGHGGFCMNCVRCSFPHCPFGK
ncbi:FmdE family protein [Fundidesulfovibrio agrisoli]|uniref:FmdE family protein n=1 Tax=Fundidesulfovibrio agrisoli TaxID=2922717 RepID=UPI001FAC3787|nr:FmdE family protein [Fundidesulfovibrio agrisoli]